MFSTLLGALPPPGPVDGTGDPIDAIGRNIADLEATGLELLSDGLPPATPDDDPDQVVARWRIAAGATSRPVKQAVRGPWSTGRALGRGSALEAAERARAIVEAVVAAGCPFVEIAEPDALSIATSADDRSGFVAAHQRLADGLDHVHLSLTITGGDVDAAGAATFFDLPYASYAFDLIAGPDNWRLIASAPTDRGVICGALDPRPDGDETRELLVWAGHYAASTAGRGIDRVGLANASSLAGASRDVALRKLERVAEASRIAAVESAEELAAILDPRTFGRRRRRAGSVRLAGPDDA